MRKSKIQIIREAFGKFGMGCTTDNVIEYANGIGRKMEADRRYVGDELGILKRKAKKSETADTVNIKNPLTASEPGTIADLRKQFDPGYDPAKPLTIPQLIRRIKLMDEQIELAKAEREKAVEAIKKAHAEQFHQISELGISLNELEEQDPKVPA